MTAIVVIGAIAGYLLAGALYARSQAEACYRRAKRGWSSVDTVNESVMLQMGWRVLAWPYAVVLDAFRGGIRAWFFGPIDDRRRRAAQLREDAQGGAARRRPAEGRPRCRGGRAARAWRDKRHSGTPAEREMADELARLLEERAAEVDL